jgi:hypothetical protein
LLPATPLQEGRACLGARRGVKIAEGVRPRPAVPVAVADGCLPFRSPTGECAVCGRTALPRPPCGAAPTSLPANAGVLETRSPAKSAPSILSASPQSMRRLGMAEEAIGEDWLVECEARGGAESGRSFCLGAGGDT